MAIVRIGGAIDAISGTLGSIVFANTTNGTVAKRRPTKVNQQSQSQLRQRATLKSLQRRWAFLSDDLRLQWATAAREYPAVNALGVQSTITAYQLFLKVNASLPNAPEVYRARPPNMRASNQPTGISLVSQQAGATVLTFAGIPNDVFNWLILFGSQPTSPNPRAHWSYWRRFFFSLEVTSPLDITDEWADFLSPPRRYQQIAVKVVHRTTYLLTSVPIIVTAEVSAP